MLLHHCTRRAISKLSSAVHPSFRPFLRAYSRSPHAAADVGGLIEINLRLDAASTLIIPIPVTITKVPLLVADVIDALKKCAAEMYQKDIEIDEEDPHRHLVDGAEVKGHVVGSSGRLIIEVNNSKKVIDAVLSRLSLVEADHVALKEDLARKVLFTIGQDLNFVHGYESLADDEDGKIIEKSRLIRNSIMHFILVPNRKGPINLAKYWSKDLKYDSRSVLLWKLHLSRQVFASSIRSDAAISQIFRKKTDKRYIKAQRKLESDLAPIVLPLLSRAQFTEINDSIAELDLDLLLGMKLVPESVIDPSLEGIDAHGSNAFSL